MQLIDSSRKACAQACSLHCDSCLAFLASCKSTHNAVFGIAKAVYCTCHSVTGPNPVSVLASYSTLPANNRIDIDPGCVVRFTGSWFSCGFHLGTTIAVPAAVLPLPFAFSQLGWPTGVIALLLATCTTFYSSWLLAGLFNWNGQTYYRYRDLVKSIFGMPLNADAHKHGWHNNVDWPISYALFAALRFGKERGVKQKVTDVRHQLFPQRAPGPITFNKAHLDQQGLLVVVHSGHARCLYFA